MLTAFPFSVNLCLKICKFLFYCLLFLQRRLKWTNINCGFISLSLHGIRKCAKPNLDFLAGFRISSRIFRHILPYIAGSPAGLIQYTGYPAQQFLIDYARKLKSFYPRSLFTNRYISLTYILCPNFSHGCINV